MDVGAFVSHSSRDAAAARQLCSALHKVGLTTWMAPDDVVGPRPWAEQIGDAIERARLMIILVSRPAIESDHVAREVAMAVRRKLPVLPVRLEELRVVGSLDYLLQLVQRVDAFPGGMERHADAIAARALELTSGASPRIVVHEVAARSTRRTVTVLSAGVTARSELGEPVDPEALRALTGRYVGTIRQIVEHHGGSVEHSFGDAVMAVFGFPVLHEDDALRAVHAASAVRDSLEKLDLELRAARGLSIAFRVGVNTGEVLTGDASVDPTTITGDTVTRAARLEQEAGPAEILLGRSTYRLVRDAVAVEPLPPVGAEGKTTAVVAFRLVSVSAGVAGHARRLDTPLVGRERELARLEQAYRQAVADRSCQLFTLLGTAGVGKSRLVAEFLASVAGEATVLKGRCLPYGEGITYWPVREIVHHAAHIDEGESADAALAKVAALLRGERDAEVICSRIASAVGLSTDAAPQEEIFWATRKLLEHLAREQPLVVLVEDIHWAEPVLLDLLEHVADLVRDAPLLLLCPARPELLDRRPGWGGGKLNGTTVLLEALPAEATERLIGALPGGRALPPELRARILAAAEGNPLYLEEMLGMLIDEQLVVERDGVWRAEGDVESVSVPPTVRALLAARLDQIPPNERAIAERASVIGRVFEQAAVTELTPESARPEVADGLLALVRKELVRPDRSELASGDAFKFRHLLIRDAAYDALPKAERAELHERFAGWLTQVAGERGTEYAEIVGYHLEQAYRYRVDLGEGGERVEQLAGRAGELLAQSGERALARGDASAAADLFRRATAVLPRDSAWAIAATSLASAEYLLSDFQSALARLDDVIAATTSLGAERLEWRARVARANIAFYGGESVGVAIVDEAIGNLERSEDAEGLAAAWLFRATLAGEAGDPSEAEAAQQALRYARIAGNKAIEARALHKLAERLLFGPSPSEEAIVEGAKLLEQAGGNLRVAAKVRSNLSAVIAMRGDFDRARTMAADGIAVLHELGLASNEAVSRTLYATFVEMLAGDNATAEAELRASYAVLDELGATLFAASVAGALAEALVLQGKDHEAEHWADIASGNAVGEDYDAQVRWRRARTRILLHRGDLVEAESLARSAVDIGARTDDLHVQGDCWATLAEVLIGAGRVEEAVESLKEALSRYEQKGNLVSAEWTLRELGRLAGKASLQA